VELLKGINDQGTTILMVTHEHDLVRHFGGRIINITNGEIVYDEIVTGTNSEILPEVELAQAMENAANGVTMSIVGINASTDGQSLMKDLLVNYAGCKEKNFHNITNKDYTNLPTIMREDLEVPEIKSVNYETFTPVISAQTQVTNGIPTSEMPTLDGYYGVKLKFGAVESLSGLYTPLYAQWNFGKGRVGTFACDLNGTWSSEFIARASALSFSNLSASSVSSKRVIAMYWARLFMVVSILSHSLASRMIVTELGGSSRTLRSAFCASGVIHSASSMK
jgi:uncharacterized membrane protein